jgi:hypothetical protein
LIRLTFDPESKRWGFYPSHQFDRREADFEELSGQEYPFNTVEAATIGAAQSLEPHSNDGSTSWIVNGVAVPNLQPHVHIIGSPGYRARIDGGLYDLNRDQLQAVHAQTKLHIDAHARSTTIDYEIPLGQQVHAACLIWDKLPRRSRPKMHDFLDEMMPAVNKRTRQRHLRAFLIVASDDWPVILATTEVEIIGLDSILKAARIYSPGPPRRKRTPLRQRYMELRDLLRARLYEEARLLVLKFDEEDANGPEGSFADDASE